MLSKLIDAAMIVALTAATSGQIPRLMQTVRIAQPQLPKESQSSKWGQPFLLPVNIRHKYGQPRPRS